MEIRAVPRTKDLERAVSEPRLPGPVALSVVAPVFNELDNLDRLVGDVAAALREVEGWELVLVDDGSTDGSRERIASIAAEDPRVRLVAHERNCGQTAAILTGFRHVRAPVVATIDADLQNDPSDLPAMLARLGEGHDAVVGYRVGRQDGFVRLASSRIANWIRNRLSGDRIRDTGCSLKVFRRETLGAIPPFDGMHRFLPTLLRQQGFDVVEHPVGHRPRIAGVSKYGIRNRALRAFVDLLAVRWMRSRWVRPPVVAGDEEGGERAP